MDTLTNEQFRQQIEAWQSLAKKENIKLPNGKPLPDKFFHVFLGVGYSTFKKMFSGKNSIRTIQPYTAKAIRFLNLLDEKTLAEEFRLAVPEYVATYSK